MFEINWDGASKCPSCDKGYLEIDDSHLEDRGCSCHIAPPCSACTDKGRFLVCNECGERVDLHENNKKTEGESLPPTAYRVPFNTVCSPKKTVDSLTRGIFNYLTFPGAYYFMYYKGFYPKDWTEEKLLEQFNVCFGYTGFVMKDGYFEIKVYTD